MPIEVSHSVSASRPIVANSSDVLQSPEAFESLLGYSTTAGRSDAYVLADRRNGISDLEQASQMLVRAIQYLTYEQRAGKVTSVPANRKAITILCGCVEGVAHVERRVPAKLSLLAWLGSFRVN